MSNDVPPLTMSFLKDSLISRSSPRLSTSSPRLNLIGNRSSSSNIQALDSSSTLSTTPPNPSPLDKKLCSDEGKTQSNLMEPPPSPPPLSPSSSLSPRVPLSSLSLSSPPSLPPSPPSLTPSIRTFRSPLRSSLHSVEEEQSDANSDDNDEEESEDVYKEEDTDRSGGKSRVATVTMRASRMKKFPSILPPSLPPPPSPSASLSYNNSSPSISVPSNFGEAKRRKTLIDYLFYYLSSGPVKDKLADLMHDEISKHTSLLIEEYRRINDLSKSKHDHLLTSFRYLIDFIELFYSDEPKDVIQCQILKVIQPIFASNTRITTWHYRDGEGSIYGWPEEIDLYVGEVKPSNVLSRIGSVHRLNSTLDPSSLRHSDELPNNLSSDSSDVIQGDEDSSHKKIELKSNRKSLIIVEMNFLKSHLCTLIKIIKFFSEKNPTERRFDILILTFNVGNEVAVIAERMGFQIFLLSDYLS